MKSKELLLKLVEDFKHIKFLSSDSFYWSPKNLVVYYDEAQLDSEQAAWSLLHELSHGILGHNNYKSDYELLSYEVCAWDKAEELAHEYSITIDLDHVDECLNTYRDWLYARSSCPTCHLNSLQVAENRYKCLNCVSVWRVSPSRFCRPYRLKQSKNKNTAPKIKLAL